MTYIILLISYEHFELYDSFESLGYSWKNIRRSLNCFGSILPAGFCFLYFTVGCNIAAVISFAVITQVKSSDKNKFRKTLKILFRRLWDFNCQHLKRI